MTNPIFDELRGKRFFLTGGTGFVGRALVSWLLKANRDHKLGCKLVVLTRQKDLRPSDTALTYVYGDMTGFSNPSGEFAGVIHAASPVSPQSVKLETPKEKAEAITGLKRVLAMASATRASRVLYLSSGAVYGKQPADLPLLDEDFLDAAQVPPPAETLYAESKRESEVICREFARSQGIAIPIARCFAFIGPEMPLGEHYAAGSFIGAALGGRPVIIRGDGTALRSYLHTSVMAEWLWTIFIRGQTGRAYNVGSETPVSIRELAESIVRIFGELGWKVGIDQRQITPTDGQLPERYVPSTRRAREELSLAPGMPLDEAIRETVKALGNRHRR